MILLFIIFILLLLLGIHRYYFPPIPDQKQIYDYALLLGCPCHDDGTLCTSAKKRCALAISEYKKHHYETLVISGGAVKNQYKEALQMKNYILDRCPLPIICETDSKNTWENFSYSKEIIQDHSVLILTSGTHARRACAIAKNFFTDYSAVWYPEHRLKHILREVASRILYIQIEWKKDKEGQEKDFDK